MTDWKDDTDPVEALKKGVKSVWDKREGSTMSELILYAVKDDYSGEFWNFQRQEWSYELDIHCLIPDHSTALFVRDINGKVTVKEFKVVEEVFLTKER